MGNALAFCRAPWRRVGVEVPRRAPRSEAVALELERLYNHAAAIAALCQTTGLSVGQAQAEIALELLAAAERWQRSGTATCSASSRSGEWRARRIWRLCERLLPDAYDELRRVADALLRTNSFLDRLEATGK